MTSRGKLSVAMFALLIPVALVIGREFASGRSLLEEPMTAWLNWVYIAAPQLLVLAVAAVNVRSRRRFVPFALLASALVAVTFQAWILFSVPPREGALAWVLYIPTWLVVLVALAVLLARRTAGTASPNLPVQRTVLPPADL